MTKKRTCKCFLPVVVCLALALRTTFGQATVSYTLWEEQSPGTFVGNVQRDMLLKGEITSDLNLIYTLPSSGNNYANLFNINETTGTITTKARVDRESVCPDSKDCVIRLDITVYRSPNIDLYKLWAAVITIVDINDNAPTFPHPSVSLSVPESGPPDLLLMTSGAIDKDTGGNNSVQDYRLSPPSDIFERRIIVNLDGSTDLGILVRKPLDREVQDFYQLSVIAVDGGSPVRSGSLSVNITVMDVNDNRPVFDRQAYNFSVKENSPVIVPVGNVNAIDADIGVNGEVTYQISSRVTDSIRTLFYIDSKSGQISTHTPLDYEKDQRFQFQVEARDNGSPRLTSAVVVTLNVEDENDNAPQISINMAPGGSNISENEPEGKFVAHVSVSDLDSGRNSEMICSLDDPSFSLQPFYEQASNMYKVVLSSSLDFERSSSHRVTITCRDRGDPPLVNSTSFTVRVLDVNDNPPIFKNRSYTGSVQENNVRPEYVLQVSASDLDTGPAGEVEFFLENTTQIQPLFSIDSRSGLIYAKSSLDREERQQYTFLVFARDKGVPSLTSSASVTINVLDVNDERPAFIRSTFDCYILEKQPIGTRVGNVSAVDMDSVANRQMTYSIVPVAGDADSFEIESATGVLKSRVSFDREVRPVLRFMVKVQDPFVPSFFDVANVTVHVLDDNDNRPVFLYPNPSNYTLVISYGTAVGTVLTTVSATDDDEGSFGKLSYYITNGDATRLFELNPMSGGLLLARSILPDDIKEYQLEIQVKDGGSPPSIATAELRVVVRTGNVTLAAQNGSSASEQNILIVVILVCVTVILAVAVLTTICLIKRIDRERQQRHATLKAEKEKMFHMQHQGAFINISPETTSGSSESSTSPTSNGAGKGRKKEVSFSVDNGINAMEMGSGPVSTLSTFKCPKDKLSGVQERENCLSQATPTLRTGSGMLNIPVSHRTSADDNHLQPVQEETVAHQLTEIFRRNGEDALSESSGETGTSDSGRGGSEDESHSNRGSTLDAEGPIYSQVNARGLMLPVLGPDILPSRGRNSSFNSLAGSNTSRLGRQRSPHVSFSGNLEFLGETTTDREDEFPPPPSPEEESSPPHYYSEHNFSTFGTPRNNNNIGYNIMLHSRPGNPGYSGVSTSIIRKTPSPMPSFADEGRQRWGSPSLHDDDDDDRTTTSGSYILNTDDLRKEIDNLTLKDMVV